jgi:mono/diheme cytochrome c family protein
MIKPRALVAYIVSALVAIAPVAHADAGKVEAGAIVYGDYCSSCHGEQLRNTSGGVTFDLRRLRPEDHDRFIRATLDGKGQMPPWRGALTIVQIESIWAYIRAQVDR